MHLHEERQVGVVTQLSLSGKVGSMTVKDGEKELSNGGVIYSR